jgi:septum formation protein
MANDSRSQGELILGSASPRRRELLGLVLPAIPFRVVAPDVDETVRPAEAAGDYLVRIVRAKAHDVAARVAAAPGAAPTRAILCADTSVIVDGRVLGKPADADEGRAMLGVLAGRTHDVWTAFVIADPQGAPLDEQIVRTAVTFRALGAAEIEAYVASGEGRDKAGGYGIQGHAAAFVEGIVGSSTNVIGLPLAQVTASLARLGLR